MAQRYFKVMKVVSPARSTLTMLVKGDVKCMMPALQLTAPSACRDAVLAIWLWLRFDSQTKRFSSKKIIHHCSLYTGVYILIGAGALMTLVDFLGCCEGVQESQCMLGLSSSWWYLPLKYLQPSGDIPTKMRWLRNSRILHEHLPQAESQGQVPEGNAKSHPLCVELLWCGWESETIHLGLLPPKGYTLKHLSEVLPWGHQTGLPGQTPHPWYGAWGLPWWWFRHDLQYDPVLCYPQEPRGGLQSACIPEQESLPLEIVGYFLGVLFLFWFFFAFLQLTLIFILYF